MNINITKQIITVRDSTTKHDLLNYRMDNLDKNEGLRLQVH